MRVLFYIFAICLAAVLLFVTVDRVERHRTLAIFLMILILGLVAAAVLIKWCTDRRRGTAYGSIKFNVICEAGLSLSRAPIWGGVPRQARTNTARQPHQTNKRRNSSPTAVATMFVCLVG
jgi:hypothetical protein